MFARVFTTAKRILSRSSSAQETPSEPKESTTSARNAAVTMVTSTRRGPVVASTPRSSARKSKRSLEVEAVEVQDTPTVKKRRKSIGKDANTSDMQPSAKEAKLPLRRRGASPKVIVPQSPAVGSPSHTSTPQAPAADEIVPETQPRQEAASPTPKSSQNATATPKSAAKRKQKTKAKAPEVAVDADEEKAEQEAAAALAKKTHIRFGSEEPTPTAPLDTTTQVKAAKPSPIPSAAEEDESDSDDEAPEEVTAESALTKAKAAEAEAARAFTAQQNKKERKRKEREQRVAEEQKQKRKKEEEKAKDALPAERYSLPALLPDSILEAAGDRRPPTPPRFLEPSAADQKKEKLNQHIKFLERGEKKIKDVKKGSLSVRVLEQQNAHLAAKVNKDTRNVREKWLKGRQTGKKQKKVEHRKVEKRSFGGGFLRGQDD